MKPKIILLTALFFLVFTSSWAQTATTPLGSGTANNPYQISSLENLYWLSQTDSIWNDSLYFKQTADINASRTSTWNSGEGFFPIGNMTTNFTGHYNGAGYTIDSLTILRSSSYYIALFGYINNATIDSLGLTNVKVEGTNFVAALVGYNSDSSSVSKSYSTGLVSGDFFVGGLVGYNQYSSLVNESYSSASVSGNYYVGGLVGKIYSFSSVSNSYSTGSVLGNKNVGGLVGSSFSSTSVSNCYSTGLVLGMTNVGGLMGYNKSSVSNCYYNSETSGQSSGIGHDESNQTVTALTTAQMKQSSRFINWDFTSIWQMDENMTFPCLANLSNVPVILHTLSRSTKINAIYTDTIQVVYMDHQSVSIELLSFPNGMILTQDSIISFTPTSCGNEMMTIRVTDTAGWSNNYMYTLQVISLNGSGTIVDPYQIGSLNDLQQVSQKSNLWDKYFIQIANIDASETSTWDSAAGFSPIGNDIIKFTGHYNGQGYTIDDLTINRLSINYIGLFGYMDDATIDSLGLTNVHIQGNQYVGGLVGYNFSSSISNSYSTGSVSGSEYVGGLVGYSYSSSEVNKCYSTGSVVGSKYVGGLVGTNSSSISNNYSTGLVSGSQYVGGLVGKNNASVDNSYYNAESSGQASGLDLIITLKLV